jgi:hypothetical protein
MADTATGWDAANWDTRETEVWISNTEPLYLAARDLVFDALEELAATYAEEFAGIAATDEDAIDWDLVVAQFVYDIVNDQL